MAEVSTCDFDAFLDDDECDVGVGPRVDMSDAAFVADIVKLDGYFVRFVGNGEFRLRVDDASDLAGDGLAGNGTSNFAGLAEFDGIVIGLSRGEIDDAVLLEMVVLDVEFFSCGCGCCCCCCCCGCKVNGSDCDIGDGVIFKPGGKLNCSCNERISNLSSLLVSFELFSFSESLMTTVASSAPE